MHTLTYDFPLGILSTSDTEHDESEFSAMSSSIPVDGGTI